MKRLLLPILFLVATAAVAADADVERIAGAILVHGHSMQYERELTDGFGARLVGTAAYDRAADWSAAQFRAAGIANVRLEDVPLSRGWERGAVTARMTAPLARTLHLTPFAWTAATPAGGVRGEIVQLTEFNPDAVRARAKELDGRIVMTSMGAMFGSGFFDYYRRYVATLEALKQAGARAMLVSVGGADNSIAAAQALLGVDDTPPLPMAELGMEDAKLIERLLASGPVSVDYSYESRFTPAHPIHNVVAEIRGSERPDEWIVVGAHLDSWDMATGAQDNGSGCAMVLEAARAIAAGRAPRRSIRFILWAGEEEGFLGSRAYATAHAAELQNCVAALNADAGAGHPKGWSTLGRADVAAAFRPIAKELLTDLGGADVSEATTFILQSDHAFFLLAGVPTLELMPDMSKYFDIHHRSSDTLDKVDAHNLAANAAILAVTAYSVADRAERLAPRNDRAAVMQILEKTHTDTFAREMGWIQ
jgi:carboxypeptidase Q